MPAPDLSLLEQAAREAGEIALRYWRQSPEAWDKGGGAGPVSEADLAVNAHLESLLRGARPGEAVPQVEVSVGGQARQRLRRRRDPVVHMGEGQIGKGLGHDRRAIADQSDARSDVGDPPRGLFHR